MDTANYMQTVSYPNGFIVVDRDAIDPATKQRIEAQGYMVIEKQPGRSLEVFYAPRQQVQYYPQPYVNPNQQQYHPGMTQAWQNSNAAGAANG